MQPHVRTGEVDTGLEEGAIGRDSGGVEGLPRHDQLGRGRL